MVFRRADHHPNFPMARLLPRSHNRQTVGHYPDPVLARAARTVPLRGHRRLRHHDAFSHRRGGIAWAAVFIYLPALVLAVHFLTRADLRASAAEVRRHFEDFPYDAPLDPLADGPSGRIGRPDV